MSGIATTLTVAGISLVLAACGTGLATESNDGSDRQEGAPPAAGMCKEGVPDCVDVIVDDDGAQEPDAGQAPVIGPVPDPIPVPVIGDLASDEALLEDARSLLGEVEEDVTGSRDDVRLGRRGTEEMMLTQDYRVGRMTIATEDDGTGVFRVVEVTVEAADGPVVVTD